MSRAILMFVLALAAIIAIPLAVIWALNLLFGLSIGYSFETWAAVIILAGVLNGRASYKGRD